MKTSQEQQHMLDMANPYPVVKQWLSEGEQLFPFIWDGLTERLEFKQIVELAEIANNTGVWIPESVLIYILENQSIFGRFSKLFRLKSEVDIVDFFKAYRAKHESEDWSEKFVLTAVKQPNFKKLLFELKFGLSETAQVEMAKRDDFVEIIEKYWPFERFGLVSAAEAIIAKDANFNKLVAYVKKNENMDGNAFADYLNSDNFTEKRTIELLGMMKSLSDTLKPKVVSTLLAYKNHDLSLAVIKGMSSDSNLDEPTQEVLLATSNPCDLIFNYMGKHRGFSGKNLFESVKIMMGNEFLSSYISTVLSYGCLDQNFVNWLAQQPDDFIKGLEWRTTELGKCRTDFWMMTLNTNKAALFMRMYKRATIDAGGPRYGWINTPDKAVLIKMLDLPNAAELVAIWDYQAGEHKYQEYGSSRNSYWYDTNQYYFPDIVLAEMIKSPSYEAIRGNVSSYLRRRMDEYVSKTED